MDRRRAIAWAGSTALTACVTAIALGSLFGGFGFDVSQPPQTPHAIGPRLTPKSPAETPGLPIETPGRKAPPAPAPAPEAAPNEPAPAPEGTAAPPPADPRDTDNYPRVSGDDQKVAAAVSISRLDATAHSTVGPMPARDVDKPNIPRSVDKAPRPVVDSNRIAGSTGDRRIAGLTCPASRCDVAMADMPKRATKPTKPTKPTRARDILADLRGFRPGIDRSSDPKNDAPVSGRSADAGVQAGTAHRRMGGRNDSRDG